MLVAWQESGLGGRDQLGHQHGVACLALSPLGERGRVLGPRPLWVVGQAREGQDAQRSLLAAGRRGLDHLPFLVDPGPAGVRLGEPLAQSFEATQLLRHSLEVRRLGRPAAESLEQAVRLLQRLAALGLEGGELPLGAQRGTAFIAQARVLAPLAKQLDAVAVA